jgi:hypothetical protein
MAMSHDWIEQASQSLVENQKRINELKAAHVLARDDAPVKADKGARMTGTAKVLSWFALLATAVLVALALAGKSVKPGLLSFPVIALAVAQLLILHGLAASPVMPSKPEPQSGTPLSGSGLES